MPRHAIEPGSIDIDEFEARYGRFDDDPDLWDEANGRKPVRVVPALTGAGGGYDAGDDMTGGL